MGGTRRYTKVDSQAGPLNKTDYNMRLVALREYFTPRNSHKECTTYIHLHFPNEAIRLKRRNRYSQTALLYNNA